MLSSSLSSAISRFITFELGKGDTEKLKSVFSSSVTIQGAIAFIIVILAETVGLWFLNEKMVIPENRLSAANWCFQFSILTFIINLISVPYNAAIIAHEKMSAFAYISILEALGKLGIAMLIMVNPIDRLVFYAGMMTLLAVFIRFIYGLYCKRHFKECNYHFVYDHDLLKRMFSFAGWQFFGTGSYLLMTQGVNILFNFFFGPLVNAARGISVAVDKIIQQFVQNFTTALNPQITKSYAQQNKEYMFSLIYSGAKYSFFLVLLFAIPLILESEIILRLWLGQVPIHAVSFLRLIILVDLIYVLSNTMMTAMVATGDIKKYQIVVGGTGLLVFPFAWVFFKMGFPPESAFIIQIVVFIIQFIYRIILLHSMINLPIIEFLSNVIIRGLLVSLLSFPIPLLLHYQIECNDFFKIIMIGVVSTMLTMTFIYYVGLNKSETEFVQAQIKKIYKNKWG